MRPLTWLVVLVGVLCIVAGATMAPTIPTTGIVETLKLLPTLPAKCLIAFAAGVALLSFAMYLRVHEDD